MIQAEPSHLVKIEVGRQRKLWKTNYSELSRWMSPVGNTVVSGSDVRTVETQYELWKPVRTKSFSAKPEKMAQREGWRKERINHSVVFFCHSIGSIILTATRRRWEMGPSRVLFDRIVQPPICSQALCKAACVREKQKDSERHGVRSLLYVCVSHSWHTHKHTHTSLCQEQAKKPERRGCV